MSVYCMVLSAGISGCVNKTEKVFEYRIAGTHSAITPVPQEGDWWMPLHQANIERMKQGNVDLLFIGDSITRHWETEGKGYEVWQKYYASRNALNMGISADRTQNVLWRLDHLPLNNISPKLAIIMIGTNNSDTFDESNTAKEISEGIIAICQDLPSTKILLLAIFEMPSPLREKRDEASVRASTIADNKCIYYVDISNKFLDKDGRLSKDIMPDFLHPNAKGYQIWAEAIEPIVAKLMK